MRRIPAVARALTSPGSESRNTLPHAFRIAGASFVAVMALGHLSALFALPAGLGDVAIGLRAPFTARRLTRGTGRRDAIRLHALGTADLVTALILGGLTGYNIVHSAPPSDALPLLPIVLIPTTGVPLLLALHIVSLRHLAATKRTPQVATQPATALG